MARGQSNNEAKWCPKEMHTGWDAWENVTTKRDAMLAIWGIMTLPETVGEKIASAVAKIAFLQNHKLHARWDLAFANTSISQIGALTTKWTIPNVISMRMIADSAIIFLISKKIQGNVTLSKLALLNVISMRRIVGSVMTFFITKKTCVNVMWLKYGTPSTRLWTCGKVWSPQWNNRRMYGKEISLFPLTKPTLTSIRWTNIDVLLLLLIPQ